MARLQYITVRETDFGGGIDQQSAENRIPQGYCEDLENADPQSTGYIVKRKGYQGYAGYLPVRVKELVYSTSGSNNATFILDDSIEIPNGRSHPLLVLGRTSSDNAANSGDFIQSTDSIEYYTQYSADIRKTFLTGTNTLTIPQTEHDLNTEFIFVGTAQSTSETELDHVGFFVDEIRIDKTTKDIELTYTNTTGSDFTGFVWLKDKSSAVGSSYVGSTTTSGAVESIATGTNTYTVLGSQSNLDNNNLIAKVFEDDGSDLVEHEIEKVELDESTGDMVFTINNTSGAAFDAYFVITSAPTAQFVTGSVANGATQSITIDTSVSGGTNFPFIACYLEPGGGADLEQVIPDSIITSESNNEITVTFTNLTGAGANFELYWDFATIKTSLLRVTSNTQGGTAFTDSNPQLTIWGLCHEEIYGTKVAREGWTTHIDSYRAPAENRLIAGLGGNLFAARLRSEGTNSTDYLMPLLYPRLQGRLAADTVIGPAFYATSETPARTRGYVTGTTGSDNLFTVTTIAYNSGTGWVDYTIDVPNMAILDQDAVATTIGSVVSTTTGLEDQLSTSQCGYEVHNGTFTIKAVTSGVDTLTISVLNSNITSSDFDEADVGGNAGIFSDQLVFTSPSPFLTGDILNSELFIEGQTITALNTGTLAAGSPATETTNMSGVLQRFSLPGGLRVVGERTSSVIPLRDFDNNSNINNIVRGDMLEYTAVGRQIRVKGVNVLSDISLSITGTGSTATATLGSGDISTLFIGKKVLISGSSSYNGVQTITALTTSTTFQFTSTGTTTESATLVGKTITVDEDLAFEDTTDNSNQIRVHSRWIPIESPEDTFNATPKTTIRYFDTELYDQQNIIRSTMVQDNLYLTNDADEVMKFDGTNIYRAGLFRWQPNLFVSTNKDSTGKIVMENPQATVTITTAITSNLFKVASGDESTFTVGNLITFSANDEVYTIQSIDNDGTNGIISVDRFIGTTATGTITRTRTFKYYFRLNAVDANDNVIASAATGADDFAVELTDDAAVNIRAIGMPIWDIYDYDRLEVQIYRTKADSAAPFYRLTTLAMNFDNAGGYLDYTDTDSDEDLITLDETNTALKGLELGTAWTQPMRAKYCTSAGNRLILGNLKDYPNLDLRLLKNSGALTQSTFLAASNNLWLFRKDSSDTLTTTDMVNRAAYEFRDISTAVDINTFIGVGGTSYTVETAAAHGLSIKDWVYLFHETPGVGVANLETQTISGVVNVEADIATVSPSETVTVTGTLTIGGGNSSVGGGWHQVATVPSATEFTIADLTASASPIYTAVPSKLLIASTSSNIPVPIGTDGNYEQLNGNRTASEPYEFLAIKRLAEAINTSMRQTNITLTGQDTFTPWMTANAGNEFNSGQLVIRQPKIFSTTMECVLPSLSGAFSVFGNNVKRAGGTSIGAVTRLFPSRIIASYQNFPEIFDNPTATVDADSDSAIDINSADGQEITAIIPFFGDAAFGAAQKSGIVVVFKTNSIYLVDLAAKDRGENPVQKLETRGKGCTAPFSVSVTKGGIMFANNTGIYRLNRNLGVDYVGRKYERKFKNTVNNDQLALATGHHDTEANSYKLSYPQLDETENSTVAVYNHTREYEGKGEGSWTTYTNHPVTGWANLAADSYFASTDGRVHIIRKLNETSDFRDDDQAIRMTILTRALDSLDSGLRKVHAKMICHYRVPSSSSGTTLLVALDLKEIFQSTDSFEVSQEAQDGLGDVGNQKVISIVSTVDSKVGVYIQLKFQNSTIDETLELAGIDFRVAAKTSEGILEAADTTT